MKNNSNSLEPKYEIGKLVKTKKRNTEYEGIGVISFPGVFTKEMWSNEPGMLYLCIETDDGLIGLITDTTEVCSQKDGATYQLAKIMAITKFGHPDDFWVFVEDLELLEQL